MVVNIKIDSKEVIENISKLFWQLIAVIYIIWNTDIIHCYRWILFDQIAVFDKLRILALKLFVAVYWTILNAYSRLVDGLVGLIG